MQVLNSHMIHGSYLDDLANAYEIQIMDSAQENKLVYLALKDNILDTPFLNCNFFINGKRNRNIKYILNTIFRTFLMLINLYEVLYVE